MMRFVVLVLLVAFAAAKGVKPKAEVKHKLKAEAKPKAEPAAAPKVAVTENECTEYPCLVFNDEFDTLNFDTWEHEITAGGGGNWEFQYYTNNRSNSYVRDGVLYIKPTLTQDSFYPGFVETGRLELWGHQPPNTCTGNHWWGCERIGQGNDYINPIQSARLRSAEAYSVNYGRIHIRAKMPTGDWLWPALWMLPRFNEYADWPMSGEIDMFESRGNEALWDSQGNPVGNTHGGCTLHWGANGGGNKYYLTTGSVDGNFADTFHDYYLEWDANSMTFLVDDVEVLHVDPGDGGFWEFGNYPNELPDENNPWVGGDKMAPFDRPFYFIMNVAVGGTNYYFGDDWTNGNGDKPWDNTSPNAPKDFWDGRDQWYSTWNGEDAAMQVDFVRVYKDAPNNAK